MKGHGSAMKKGGGRSNTKGSHKGAMSSGSGQGRKGTMGTGKSGSTARKGTT